MVEYSDNVGIAFAVVIGAGLSTSVGAAVVFFPTLVQYANRRTLAAGLGISAGVMTYVSFVEIFFKSVQSFMDADFLENQAYLSATLCFFAGIVMMICLNLLVHGIASHNLITKGQYGETEHSQVSDDSSSSSHDESFHDDTNSSRAPTPKKKKKKKKKTKRNGYDATMRDECESELRDISTRSNGDDAPKLQNRPEPVGSHLKGTCCTSEDPVGRLEDLHSMARNIMDKEDDALRRESLPGEVTLGSNTDVLELSETDVDVEAGHKKKESRQSTASSTKKKKKKKAKEPTRKDKQRLTMMSLSTAVAVGLHNFPEGLATFVATLQDPAVGAVLAVAIAIHNIPEGLCVAMPVYYATGNRWRAFGWGLISGVSEPLAAVLGWLVLARRVDDITYAVLFGLVSGMMIVISIKELLPTAHRYDPNDSVVTNMFILGMAIMAASLVLFQQL